ncbi:unnamed protein product [Prorocentrum cordatum]|uniref:Uncharacterized protein n=1 Tax=Prorocentrum cordatum TaxID=2364126 RepID=A0ABN9TDD4_9DINO|nr:unnamed protein product [Polarella glacialis]
MPKKGKKGNAQEEVTKEQLDAAKKRVELTPSNIRATRRTLDNLKQPHTEENQRLVLAVKDISAGFLRRGLKELRVTPEQFAMWKTYSSVEMSRTSSAWCVPKANVPDIPAEYSQYVIDTSGWAEQPPGFDPENEVLYDKRAMVNLLGPNVDEVAFKRARGASGEPGSGALALRDEAASSKPTPEASTAGATPVDAAAAEGKKGAAAGRRKLRFLKSSESNPEDIEKQLEITAENVQTSLNKEIYVHGNPDKPTVVTWLKSFCSLATKHLKKSEGDDAKADVRGFIRWFSEELLQHATALEHMAAILKPLQEFGAKQTDIFAKASMWKVVEAMAAQSPQSTNALPKEDLKPSELSVLHESPLHIAFQTAREAWQLKVLREDHKSGNGARLEKLEALMEGAEKTAEMSLMSTMWGPASDATKVRYLYVEDGRVDMYREWEPASPLLKADQLYSKETVYKGMPYDKFAGLLDAHAAIAESAPRIANAIARSLFHVRDKIPQELSVLFGEVCAAKLGTTGGPGCGGDIGGIVGALGEEQVAAAAKACVDGHRAPVHDAVATEVQKRNAAPEPAETAQPAAVEKPEAADPAAQPAPPAAVEKPEAVQEPAQPEAAGPAAAVTGQDGQSADAEMAEPPAKSEPAAAAQVPGATAPGQPAAPSGASPAPRGFKKGDQVRIVMRKKEFNGKTGTVENTWSNRVEVWMPEADNGNGEFRTFQKVNVEHVQSDAREGPPLCPPAGQRSPAAASSSESKPEPPEKRQKVTLPQLFKPRSDARR